MRFRLFLFLLASFSLSPFSAFAFDQWQQPTADELKMTSDPAAPDAPAVYLYREEISDEKLHMHSLYVRIKILTEKGKSRADVEIPYESHEFSITNVEGRTIHSDGTIVSFTGKPYEKLIVKSANFRYSAKVFSMPAVEVGSILEYRYKLRYDDNIVLSPEWIVQQPLYVHRAHYNFVLAKEYLTLVNKRGDVANTLLYWQNLPKGQEMKQVRDQYELDVHDIPAEPDENFMPPIRSLGYRVYFYYSAALSGAEFWKSEGKYWSKKVDHFANSSPALTAAVGQITSGADTPEKKLLKIYAAVMGLENTDFTREQSEQEKKAKGIKEAKNAEDIWNQKTGNSNDLALLFLAMARAAGMKSYAMQVVNRDSGIFNASFLSTSQLDDVIVVVNLNGKEQWFDPGSRYCDFGKLHWKHSWTGGIRQTDQGTELAASGGTSRTDTQVRRAASLTMDDTGEIHGVIRINMTGNAALRWKQKILQSDEEKAKHDLEEELNGEMPPGIEVTVKGFLGKDSFETILMAVADVKGRSGSTTQTRMFFPAEIFRVRNRSPFVDQPKRQSPIDLHYPYTEQDQISIKVPNTWTVESAPKSTSVPFPQMAYMAINSKTSEDTVTIERVFALGNIIFHPEEYSSVRDFYQKVDTADQQQLVLKRTAQAKTE